LVLIYTHKITPRLNFVFKQIFTRILQIPIRFTTKVEEFVAHSGVKFTYSKMPLGKEFFIRNHSLLYEQGVTDVAIKMNKWDDVPCFFALGEKSSIPYDIFAASFYLLSRYEEYQPFSPDKTGRFQAPQSLAFQHDFLEQPVVDIWAYKFLEKLKEKFPDFVFEKRKYKSIHTLNIKEAFIYKNKGVIRGIGGFIMDLFHFRFRNVARRLGVLFGVKKDPYDTYDFILQLNNKYTINTVFFFLFTTYTTFDTNVSYANRKYRLLIKSLIDYTAFGVLFSHYTMNNVPKLIKEKTRFENLVNQPVTKSRQHNNRLEIPKTYQTLVNNFIEEEYSMGYENQCGFRASTCTPFYFYDLEYEIQTPLKLMPFAVVDTALLLHNQLTSKEAILKIKILQKEVQKVGGVFISVFHNATFNDMEKERNWRSVYEAVVQD